MEEIYIGESDIDENGEKTPRVGVGLLCAGGAGGAGCAGGAGGLGCGSACVGHNTNCRIPISYSDCI